MRLYVGLLLPVFAGTASAISDAKAYIFQDDEWQYTSHPPTLSPDEARLVFAQRLGVSQYHSLDHASEDTLSYINQFGGQQKQLFAESGHDQAAELVLLLEGGSDKNSEHILSAWSSVQPAFTIPNSPSSSENLELVFNLDRQLGPDIQECPFEDDIKPDNIRCWKGKSKIIQLDLAAERPSIEKMLAQDALADLAKSRHMNIMVVLMPKSYWSPESKKVYGSYEKVSQKPLDRRQHAEEPVTEARAASSKDFLPKQVKKSSSPDYISGVAPLCYTSLESCIGSTNNCSGHGECYQKTNGTNVAAPCFACQCMPQFESFSSNKKSFTRTSYWGGGACQKEDISGPFWLMAGFTVVMVGLVAWVLGLLYSVGEEKLPGVIGAGVSSRAG